MYVACVEGCVGERDQIDFVSLTNSQYWTSVGEMTFRRRVLLFSSLLRLQVFQLSEFCFFEVMSCSWGHDEK